MAEEKNKLQRLLVLIPTYNESESIVSLVQNVLNADSRLEVLVIDDGSPDGTADLVKKTFPQRVHLMRRKGKLGYASACREGIFWGLNDSFDAFIIMDADGSHNPRDIPLLLQKLEEGLDVAAGSRYVNGVRVLNWPISRLLLSVGGGIYVRTLTGLPLTDPTSGFKAIRRHVAEKLQWKKLNSNGYCFNVETYFFAWKQKFKLAEVPIIFTERRLGASKMSFKIMIEAVLRVMRLFFYRWCGLTNK